MYKICKTEQSIERQKLFQTTLLAMMKKQRYQEITVTALCKEMGIPRKTFYRYFEELGDVLLLSIDEMLTGAFLYLEIEADVVGFFEYWKQQKELLDALEKGGLSYLLVERIYERMESDTVQVSSFEQKIRYTGYVSALMSMLITWHHGGMKQTPEEMSRLVKEVFHL